MDGVATLNLSWAMQGPPRGGEHALDETSGNQVKSSFRGVQMGTQFGGSRGRVLHGYMDCTWVGCVYPCGWSKA